jgi:hypothetical protein
VKDRKDADSTVIRDSTWDWYKTAMRTRLRKDGWIVFVNTRWHEDDPAGRILPGSEIRDAMETSKRHQNGHSKRQWKSPTMTTLGFRSLLPDEARFGW